MKTWYAVLLMGVLMAGFASTAAAQAAAGSKAVPKYDVATEVTLKGTVVDVSDRDCPVSGGMGFHFNLKQADGQIIEVHVAASKYIKDNDMRLNKGDQIEVTGSKVKFEGVDTVFAREATRGNDTFVFRDKSGKPVW
jgi:DNA/RNA endonuclease YhcR with UshA esterase domain